MTVSIPPTDVLTLTDLTKSYGGGVAALESCSLTVRSGELVSVLGPSG